MKRITSFILIAFTLGCAIQVAPTGGLKDEVAPKILSEKPESSTTQFDEDEFVVSFDEFVQLDRLKEQLVVSPPLEHTLSTAIRGKRLKVKIKDTLKESTTYVFNFGNAIVDIRENNPVENYTYVLSTGTFIDSGKIAGRVINAFEAVPAAKVTVMAYSSNRENLDSLPYLEKPDYVSKTDDYGDFILEYMKEGDYKLFALKDNNDNYLFDKQTEMIAFLDSTVSTAEKIDSVRMFLFEEDHELQYIKEQEENGPSIHLIFNLDVDTFSYSTELVDSIRLEPLLVDIDLPDDSIMIWWPDLKMRFPLIIDADTLRDTLKVGIDTIQANSRGSNLRITNFGQHQFFTPPFLKFNYPLDSINTALIKLINKDSVELPFELKGTRRAMEYLFIYEQVEGMRYSLSIDSGAFIDIYGHINDSSGFSFTLDEESDYGSLEVRIELEREGPYILQLTTGKGKFIKEVYLTEPTYLFEHLKSGTYGLKLIIDENGNQEWDTGEYLKAIHPEQAINYEGEIRIRNRWAKEVDWIIE